MLGFCGVLVSVSLIAMMFSVYYLDLMRVFFDMADADADVFRMLMR